MTLSAGDADSVPVKVLADTHGVDLDDVLSNKRIGNALMQGAVVPNWSQAQVACVLQVTMNMIVIIVSRQQTTLLQDAPIRSAVILGHALQARRMLTVTYETKILTNDTSFRSYSTVPLASSQFPSAATPVYASAILHSFSRRH